MASSCKRFFVGALLTLSCTYVGSANAAPLPIARGDITGHVYMTPMGGPLLPAAGVLVFLQREDVADFQRGVITDPLGAYRFTGVPVGGTYLISPPAISSPLCPFQMILNPPSGSPTAPTVLPTGLLLQPGTTPDVDLRAPPSCAGASPVFFNTYAENLVVGGFLVLRTATQPLDFVAQYERSGGAGGGLGGDFDPPWYAPPGEAEVKLEFLDDPEPHRVLTAHPDGFLGVWTFPDDPLEEGERVRVSVDPDQLASIGLRATSPTSYELTFHAGTPPLTPDGTALEFQVVPIFTQEGRVFCEQPAADGTFDGDDAGLEGYSVGIWDQLRSAPGDDPLQTTTTDADGLFAFPGLPPGFYRVEVLGAHATGNQYFTFVSDEFDPPNPIPLEIPYVDTAPPVIASATASPAVIWPANHQMVHVDVTVDVTDDCDAEPVCGIIAVTCTPADPAPKGKKAAEPNWVITGPLTVDLRAEKASVNKVDRVYTILVRCTDMTGNATDTTVTVTVPHDQGN